MSMNLAFKKVCCNSLIEFPFQTPTDLTKKVLLESNKNKRLQLIENQLIKWQWDQIDINKTMSEIKELFNNNKLQLIEI